MAIKCLQKKKISRCSQWHAHFSKVYNQKTEMKSRKRNESKNTFQASYVPNLVLFYIGFPTPLATVPCSQGQLSWARTPGCLRLLRQLPASWVAGHGFRSAWFQPLWNPWPPDRKLDPSAFPWIPEISILTQWFRLLRLIGQQTSERRHRYSQETFTASPEQLPQQQRAFYSNLEMIPAHEVCLLRMLVQHTNQMYCINFVWILVEEKKKAMKTFFGQWQL